MLVIDNYITLQDREPLLPEGSYMKFDESGASDLLGESPLILNEARSAQCKLRAATKEDGVQSPMEPVLCAICS